MGTRVAGRRWAARLTVVVALAALAACSSGGNQATELPERQDTPGSTSTGSASTATPRPRAEAIDAIKDLYDAYWEAVVTSRNGPEADPALFQGLVLPQFIERELRTAQQYIKGGIHQTGHPQIEASRVSCTLGYL